MTSLTEGCTAWRGPLVLPHDCSSQWRPTVSIPRHHCLSLIRDADGADRLTILGQSTGDVEKGLLNEAPYLAGVVFDPAGLGVVLGEFPIGNVADLGGFVDG